MQFNRNEYLKGNFDDSILDERKNAYFAQEKKGLDWNNYIKDYFKRCLGDAIGTFNYPWQLVQPFTNLGPFIEFGLFNQAADYLDTLKSDDAGFNTNKALWSARLRSADDYEYQKSLDPNFKTFTVDQMIKDGTIDGYLALTGKKPEDFEEENEEIEDKDDINYEEITENLKKYNDEHEEL